MKLTKVLYYKDHFRLWGGIERIWINKMNYLSEDTKYGIFVVTNSQEKHDFVYPLSNKVTHIDLDICIHHAYYYPKVFRPFIKIWKSFLFFIKLQKTINQIKPDYIIVDSTHDPMIFRVFHRGKIIGESHTAKSFLHNEKEDTKQMFHRYETKADIVVSLTKGEANEWKSAKQVEIIPNFIEKQPKPSQPEKDYKRVISSGRLVMQKRQEDLIKAWGKVADKHPDWTLDIYGDGEKQGELQRQIQHAGLQKNIRILPHIDNFFEELRKCDFFVLSSLYEGFSLVIAEAMMMGRPCVSYDCPYGPSDLIDNKKDGLLVSNGNTDELSDAIIWMIEHPKERIQMGQLAYQSIQKYTPEFIIPKWKKLFEENKE